MKKNKQQFEACGLSSDNFPNIDRKWYLGLQAGKLWTTHGLPFEIFNDLCRDLGMAADRSGFDFYMEWHKLGLGTKHLVVYRNEVGTLCPA